VTVAAGEHNSSAPETKYPLAISNFGKLGHPLRNILCSVFSCGPSFSEKPNDEEIEEVDY
jgi:hypothetical protein